MLNWDVNFYLLSSVSPIGIQFITLALKNLFYNDFILALVHRWLVCVKCVVHRVERMHSANRRRHSIAKFLLMWPATRSHHQIWTIYLRWSIDVPSRHNGPTSSSDLDALTQHAVCSSRYCCYQCHPRMKMAKQPFYPLLPSWPAACPWILGFAEQHLQLPVTIVSH